MSNHRTRAIAGAALVAIILLGSALSMAQRRTTFGEVIARKLTVLAGGFAATGPVALDSTLDVDGATTLNSTLDVDGNLSSGVGNLTIADDVVVIGALGSTGAISTATTLNVTGATTLGGALTVNNNANITGTFNASGNSTVGGTFGVTGDTGLSADLLFAAQAPVTVLAGVPITPTGTNQEITASGAVSTNLIADAPGSGTILILINVGAQEITLAEAGGNLVLSGDTALGQWDTITLINYVANWIEIAQANN